MWPRESGSIDALHGVALSSSSASLGRWWTSATAKPRPSTVSRILAGRAGPLDRVRGSRAAETLVRPPTW